MHYTSTCKRYEWISFFLLSTASVSASKSRIILVYYLKSFRSDNCSYVVQIWLNTKGYNNFQFCSWRSDIIYTTRHKIGETHLLSLPRFNVVRWRCAKNWTAAADINQHCAKKREGVGVGVLLPFFRSPTCKRVETLGW